jgi:hypothetical protein
MQITHRASWGDPPLDPRFLTSLGALTPAGLVNHATEGLRERFPQITSVIVLPGGSSPSPPFSRFARRAVPGWAGEPCYRRAEGTIPSDY